MALEISNILVFCFVLGGRCCFSFPFRNLYFISSLGFRREGTGSSLCGLSLLLCMCNWARPSQGTARPWLASGLVNLRACTRLHLRFRWAGLLLPCFESLPVQSDVYLAFLPMLCKFFTMGKAKLTIFLRAIFFSRY